MRLHDGEQPGDAPAWADEQEPLLPDPRTARLRCRQLRERLAGRFPRAAADCQIGSILSGLRDALGDGPEAAEAAGERRPELYRRQVTPDMAVTADGGAVTLEVTDGLPGHVVRRVALSDIAAFFEAVEEARGANGLHDAEADERRREGIDEARRARGRLTKIEAVLWLVARGTSRGGALRTVNTLRGEGGEYLGMSYDGTYWVIPRECGDGTACENSCAAGPCSRRCRTCLRLAWTASAPCPACPDALRRTPRARMEAGDGG